MVYKSTKMFGPFSCCFRQYKADSHCRLLHGYGLTFKVEFAAHTLNDKNWVVDFGGLKSFKTELESIFDHTLVVAADDPALGEFVVLQNHGLADVRVIPYVGCEAFAEYVSTMAEQWLDDNSLSHRVTVSRVECWEHPTNSAIYEGDE